MGSVLRSIGIAILMTITPSIAFAQESHDELVTALQECEVSSHTLPSLMPDLIHRANIQGYEEENCTVEYTFAQAEQPEQEAVYMTCVWAPAMIDRVVASVETGETLEIGDECSTDSDWAEELGL